MPYKNNETRRVADGLRWDQRRKKDRERYANHPEVFITKSRKWRKNNPEHLLTTTISQNEFVGYSVLGAMWLSDI